MPLREDILTPIPGDNPAGTDVRYELYDIIREARREDIPAPTGGYDRPPKLADWATAAREAANGLATRSKDLQLAVWLVEASYHRDSFAGMASALRVTAQMLEAFWDTLYPPLEDGDAEARAEVLGWLGSDKQPLLPAIRLAPITSNGLTVFKLREAEDVKFEADADDYDKRQARQKKIKEGKMTGEEFTEAVNATPKAWLKQRVAEISAAIASLDLLDKVSTEKFGRDAPGYARLRNAIEEVGRVVGELLRKRLETDPDPIEVAPSVDEVSAGNGAGPEVALGSEAAAGAQTLSAEPTSRDDATQRVVVAARWLRRDQPTSPTSYMMLRALRWGELRVQAPEPDPRMLAAPTPQSRMQLRGLMLDAKWLELLDAAEVVMSTPAGRGWLDLQRYALRAVDELGPEYGAVGAALRSELRSLLREIPSLVDLTMMDGLPTASPETRNWLRAEFAGAEPEEVAIEAEPAGAAPTPAAADGRDRAYERALGEVRAGRAQKGIELLFRELDREKSARGRFLRQAQLAHIMVDSGFEAIARPILDEMLQRIETHKLEEWENGALLAQPLAALYRCLQKAGEDAARQQQLYLRICRLDPVQALSFGPRS